MQGVLHGSKVPKEWMRLSPGCSTYLNLDVKFVFFSISINLFLSSPFFVSGMNHTDSILLESLFLCALTFLDLMDCVTLISLQRLYEFLQELGYSQFMY